MTSTQPRSRFNRTPPSLPAPTTRRSLTVIICLCVVLVVGMVASVNLAIPDLAADSLHPSGSGLVWIVDIYVVFFACLVIPGGAAGDRFGRKRVLIGGLAVFTVGCVASALTPDLALLLVSRAVTGVGAAAVLPNTLAVLLHATPAARRGPTVALWASMTGIGGAFGNVAGGALLLTGSWRWLFVAGAAVALTLAASVARVATVSPRRAHRIDPVGAVLLTAAAVALLIGIVQGPESGWGSPLVVVGFIASAVLMAAWVFAELRIEHPLLDPRLFMRAELRNACLGMAAVFFGMFALYYVNASLLQYGRGFSVLQAGCGIIPITVPIIIGTRHVARLVARIGSVAVLAVAFVLIAAGLCGLSTVGTSSYFDYAVWLFITGCGLMLALPTLSASITSALPHEQAGVGAGLQATTREFGSALGVAVIGTVLTSKFASALHHSNGDEHGAHTVAQALHKATPAQAHATIHAFVSAADSSLLVLGIAVAIIGALVVMEASLSRRRDTNKAANAARASSSR